MRLTLGRSVRAAVLLVASAGLLLLGAFEILMAYPVAWYLYSAVVAIFTVASFAGTRRPLRSLAAVVFVAAVATVLFVVPWSTRKPFLRSLYSIRPGMTEAEARSIMADQIIGTGWRGNPFGAEDEGELTIPSALVFRHSNDGAFNSDWGIVYLRDGKVVRVEFSAD